MGSQRAKTAFELAMEKVAGMPKLNSEEIKEEHKKESIAKGQAIAQNYLQNIHHKTDIQNEIAAFSPDQEGYGRKSALECLSQALSLTNSQTSRHILDGIAALNPNVSTDAALKRLNNIIDAFQKELAATYVSMEKIEVKRLKKEGISGSAIKPNLKAQNSWQEKQAELTASHTDKLNNFQKSLLPPAMSG
ncbi:MAG: hypothetical protein HOE30_04775 [Deltaproteobacteria bacterium]|jgi:hypothetical protein|nr:hypothetical protein [Deltaproteobacteria bacterium]